MVLGGWTRRRFARGLLYVVSIGLALHLFLPQVPGLERSVDLLAKTAPLLVFAAFLAELLSELCYAELLGRSVGLASGTGASVRSRRRAGIGLWFTLRLTVTGYGAAHVLPGGGATAATVTYGALKGRGFEARSIGAALAVVSTLVYGVLGVIFAGSLAYMVLNRDLDPAGTSALLAGLVLVIGACVVAYAAYRNPLLIRRALVRLVLSGGRVLGRDPSRRRVEGWADERVSRLKGEIGAVLLQLRHDPGSVTRLGGLALGYWAFDVACLVTMFYALGVPVGVLEILVAYGVATAAGTLPLTPGGIGVFEATMLGTLALLGVGSEATIPILGYRLFNFWLPIPLAVVFYPTLNSSPRSSGPG